VITEKDIENALARPTDFAWFGDDKFFETWGLCGPSVHRDSDILTQSNFDVIHEDMLENGFSDDIEVHRCSHWAVGWIDHMAVRVIDDEGKPTAAFEYILDWNDRLSDYPVADETDFSRREYEDCLETIDLCYVPRETKRDGKVWEVSDDLPDSWLEDVYSYLFDTYSVCHSEELCQDYVDEAFFGLGLMQEVKYD
jgi:hypothetical protein